MNQYIPNQFQFKILPLFKMTAHFFSVPTEAGMGSYVLLAYVGYVCSGFWIRQKEDIHLSLSEANVKKESRGW